MFLTTIQTLNRVPNSFFTRLIDEKSELNSDKVKSPRSHDFIWFLIRDTYVLHFQDETGAFLIDRDPKYFQPVLNFLRHGKLILDIGVNEEGVLEEADFFGVAPLIALLKTKINQRELNPSFDKKKVYRVIQCQENELTQMVSTMSDDWNFEQLINIPAQFNYGGEEHTEYICIVSRESGGNLGGEPTAFNDRAKALQQKGSRM